MDAELRSFHHEYLRRYSTSEEEKRLRTFKRFTLPKLTQGAYFELVAAESSDQGLVAKLSTSVLSGFMGSTSSAAVPAAQQDIVVVTLSAEELKLCWKTMELVRNKPKAEGSVALAKIANVSESDGEISLTNAKNERVLVLKSSERAQAAEWVAMVLEALSVLREDIEDQNTQSRGALYRQQRLLEMEKRKRAREQQKKELDRKLGAKGYIKK